MGLLNSPLANILTGQPINYGNALGMALVNPGGGSGSNSTGNAGYDAVTGTKAQPITASSASAETGNPSFIQTWFIQILIGLGGARCNNRRSCNAYENGF